MILFQRRRSIGCTRPWSPTRINHFGRNAVVSWAAPYWDECIWWLKTICMNIPGIQVLHHRFTLLKKYAMCYQIVIVQFQKNICGTVWSCDPTCLSFYTTEAVWFVFSLMIRTRTIASTRPWLWWIPTYLGQLVFVQTASEKQCHGPLLSTAHFRCGGITMDLKSSACNDKKRLLNVRGSPPSIYTVDSFPNSDSGGPQ